MTTDVLLLATGFSIAILPFLGIPSRIDTIILCVLGALVASIGIALRRASHRSKRAKEEGVYGA